jgi:hypothetical protein
VEMKVNYPNNKKNTQMDFSDNFHNIKNLVQVDHHFFLGAIRTMDEKLIFPALIQIQCISKTKMSI